MIPQTTELSQIQAAFIDKDNRIEELMRQINSAQSLLNSLKDTANSFVGNGKITIQTYAGSNVGDFTVNQKEDKTITLPQQATVNNGTLTIQKNGTSVGTFTANQSGNTTANITVPTKTSEITNDSDFVSDANYVHTDNNFTNADKIEIGKINNSLQFTYVVDNPQKLADWANNVDGNDYTSVLIKKGEYSLSIPNRLSIFDNTNAITQCIVSEYGAKIIITGTKARSGYIFNGYKNIHNITIQDNTIGNSHYLHCFRQCSCIYNCHLIDNSQASYWYGFSASDTIIDTDITFTSGSSTTNIATAFALSCKNISRCKVSFSGNAADSSFARDCYSLYNNQSVGTSNSYVNSYSSPTANATYACANTLNGGWNQ